MPNSQNKSKDQSNIVKPKKRSTKAAAPNPNQEQADKKGGDSTKDIKGSSSTASKKESKGTSDSNSND